MTYKWNPFTSRLDNIGTGDGVGSNTTLRIQTEDSTTAGFPNTLKFPNGTVVDNTDSSFSITFATGGESVASSVFERGTQTVVAAGSQVTVATLSNTSALFWLDSATGSGNIDGEWDLVIDTVTVLTMRAGDSYTMNKDFPTPIRIGTNSTVQLKVTHYHSASTADFEASLIGHLR